MYLAVACQVSTEVTSNVDSVVIQLVVFDGPQLFAAKRRPGRVDREAESLCCQVFAVLVDQSDLPRRRLPVVLERRRGTPGRQLAVYSNAVRHEDESEFEFVFQRDWLSSVSAMFIKGPDDTDFDPVWKWREITAGKAGKVVVCM